MTSPVPISFVRMVTLTGITVAICAAEDRRLDGEDLALAAGLTDTHFTIGINGATLTATAPATLAGTLSLEALGATGLTASVVAISLRAVTEDDWRSTQVIAGTRVDTQIFFPTAAPGTAAERKRWGIGGNDGDWANFSFQWDGWLRVFTNGTDLATNSDDGSRVWIDRNGDGQISSDEWGDNGWTTGHGAVQATVQHGLNAGMYRMRVQYEEGDGANSMQLLWNDPNGDGQHPNPGKTWQVVPVEGFVTAAKVSVSGPVTVVGPVLGEGTLALGEGARLGVVPQHANLIIDGHVSLAADLDLRQTTVNLAPDATLDLAGHRLRAGRIAGTGTLDLTGGELDIVPGTFAAKLRGAGSITCVGSLTVDQLAPEVQIKLGSVRAANRCVTRLALQAPLTTVVLLREEPALQASGVRDQAGEIVARITVPTDAPAGLGVGAWRADRSGQWYQQVCPLRLIAGVQAVHLSLDPAAMMAAEGHGGTWSASTAIDAQRVGLFLFADVPSTVLIGIDAELKTLGPDASGSPKGSPNALTDCVLDGFDGALAHAATGVRWSLAVRPLPYPAEPFDPALYALDLAVTEPDGSNVTLAGFHDQPVIASDRGDLEQSTSAGAPCFRVRFRPRLPGVHHLRLTATRAGCPTTVIALPDLVVSGQPWDGIIKVDKSDPRFFSADGAFIWPAGCNLNSTYDVRSVSALKTKLTPDRGSLTRAAFLERLAAGGGTACEAWLSPWNLGLEWSTGWPGFRGPGRYHDGHAAALDRFLDRAEQLGVRVNLSIFNHGMARAGDGEEEDWRFHPYNRRNGGWLDSPAQLFTDPRAFAYQQRYFRYLGARYGDSPALLGWKLWAEVNLTHAPTTEVSAWHARASAALRARDPYQHPITTHWCGDWTVPDQSITTQPGISYVTIDAYHGDETAIAELLNQSTRDPRQPTRGLASLGKPILVTEFGGNAGGTSIERMRAEFAVGPWAGLVSGHGGSPMLWWFEWIDQEDRFAAYGAINRFVAGEDLRGTDAKCIAPAIDLAAGTASQASDLWCRAWSRPGRMLGYIVDRPWSMNGGPGRLIGEASLNLGDEVRPGEMQLEWWDPAAGAILSQQQLNHPGGALALPVPAFRQHLAFKLWRLPATPR